MADLFFSAKHSGERAGPATTGLTLLFLSLAGLLLTGCGEKQVVRVHPDRDQPLVNLTASSYDFAPAEIRVPAGGSLLFRIHNVSGSEHNFTIENPGGEKLESVHLPPEEVREVRIRFLEPGIYHFHCDLPFHPLLGMKGEVIAE